MNSINTSAALLDWVDFKWLMAGEGCRLDLDRLQHDPIYAAPFVERALGSRQQALRRLALKLKARSSAV